MTSDHDATGEKSEPFNTEIDEPNRTEEALSLSVAWRSARES
jgi:hypothetical protein